MSRRGVLRLGELETETIQFRERFVYVTCVGPVPNTVVRVLRRHARTFLFR